MSQTITALRAPTVDAQLVARTGLVASLVGASVVHSTVVQQHYTAWALAGLFFLLVQMAQAMLAVAVVLFWGSSTARAVILVSAAILAVWLLSRTVGLPFAPEEFARPEAIGAADLACCVLEVAAMAMALPWASSHAQHNPPSSSSHLGRTVAVAALLAGAAALVTVLGVRPGLAEAPTSEHGHAPHAAASFRAVG